MVRTFDNEPFVFACSPTQPDFLFASQDIIGGGFSVGTLAIVEEDIYSTFSQYLLRYFVVEGLACQQRLYVGSADGDTQNLLKSLPHISSSQAHLSPNSSSAPEEKVRPFSFSS